MKDKIIELLRNSDRALNIQEIYDSLGFSTVEDMKALMKCLKDMEKDLDIYHSKKDRYMSFEDGPLKKGILRANKKGYGFVDVEDQEDDIFIPIDNINGAIDGDTVLVEITSPKSDEKEEGRILKIVKRANDTYVGEINFKNDIGYITLDDKKINLEIEVPISKSMNTVDGHKVLVKVTTTKKNKCLGEVIKVIGHKNDPGVDILSIVYKYNIEDRFPDDVIEQLKTIPNSVREEDKKGRVDLTNEVIFTIDGDDTKDIDDAISIEKLDNGNYKLGVHIADVSYYVKENTPLDNDAMERGTSVYLVDRVIPMLPHELSNGICSLNPNVERLAISCVMEIDKSGQTVDYSIFESVIKSRIQMTYKKVNMILSDKGIPEGYEEFVDKLKLMKELADILRKMKHDRGSIDFDVDEAKILVDEKCHPTEIVLRERDNGEMLIEDFMIAANECVATHIYFMQLPFIYRVHEYPVEEKIRSFLGFLSSLGYNLPLDIKDTKPKTIQQLLEFLKDKKEYKILSSLLLRNMQKAKYIPENLGHYGLASKCYTHFTSPIRRYPDTTVHRLLRTYLFNKQLDSNTISHWEEKLIYIGEHSSERERASVECERDVESMKMAEYMEEHIGEEFEGMISSVLGFGMFVELDNLIEGLVPIKDMKGFCHYDEERMTLTGKKNHIVYRIGDRVLVKVVRANKEESAIDFEIIKKL
ncbi:MAG: ribonuclease R [Bacilli bacterium]